MSLFFFTVFFNHYSTSFIICYFSLLFLDNKFNWPIFNLMFFYFFLFLLLLIYINTIYIHFSKENFYILLFILHLMVINIRFMRYIYNLNLPESMMIIYIFKFINILLKVFRIILILILIIINISIKWFSSLSLFCLFVCSFLVLKIS